MSIKETKICQYNFLANTISRNTKGSKVNHYITFLHLLVT